MLDRYRAVFEDETESPLCLAVVDIDYFKKINDTYGHAVGDKALAFTASIMMDCFRKSDLLIRWGGEEFLVFLRHTGIENAETLMERFRLKIQNSPMIIVDDQINIHLTIGLTEHHHGTPINTSVVWLLDMINWSPASSPLSTWLAS